MHTQHVNFCSYLQVDAVDTVVVVGDGVFVVAVAVGMEDVGGGVMLEVVVGVVFILPSPPLLDFISTIQRLVVL